MILAHKIQLSPTVKQERYLRKAAGCSRYTWNWAVAEAERHYRKAGKCVNFNDLKKRWNKEKPEWTRETLKDANQQPFADLRKAYARFFKKQAGKPAFKSKHKSKDSFYISNDKLKIAGKEVRIPLVGWIKTTEELRFSGKITAATASRIADRWFISIHAEVKTANNPGTETVGVDLGLKNFAALSSGETIQSPMPLRKGLRLLRTRSRQHSRKQKGSKNKAKSAMKLARLYARIANVRKDFLHKITSDLVTRAKLLVIEDLSMAGMSKRWGRQIADLGLYEFRRQLAYKCELNGVALAVADKWFPSTQLCSCCGARKKLELSERKYVCSDCGFSADRDLNAALNLHTVGLAEINARGHEGSGYQHTLAVKPSWMKQELNRAHI